jgi:hypothetical protein
MGLLAFLFSIAVLVMNAMVIQLWFYRQAGPTRRGAGTSHLWARCAVSPRPHWAPASLAPFHRCRAHSAASLAPSPTRPYSRGLGQHACLIMPTLLCLAPTLAPSPPPAPREAAYFRGLGNMANIMLSFKEQCAWVNVLRVRAAGASRPRGRLPPVGLGRSFKGRLLWILFWAFHHVCLTARLCTPPGPPAGAARPAAGAVEAAADVAKGRQQVALRVRQPSGGCFGG